MPSKQGRRARPLCNQLSEVGLCIIVIYVDFSRQYVVRRIQDCTGQEAGSADSEMRPMLREGLLRPQTAIVCRQVLREPGPEAKLRGFGFRQRVVLDRPRRIGNRTAPIIRLRNNIELGRGGAFTNAPELNLQSEETKFIIGNLVQPIHSSAVFFTEPRSDPYNGDRVQPRRVRQ